MSQYPKDVLGNKVLEDMYSFTLKARSKMERLLEDNAKLESELRDLKADYEAKKVEIETIKTDVTKTKQDIEKSKDDIKELKPKGS